MDERSEQEDVEKKTTEWSQAAMSVAVQFTLAVVPTSIPHFHQLFCMCIPTCAERHSLTPYEASQRSRACSPTVAMSV